MARRKPVTNLTRAEAIDSARYFRALARITFDDAQLRRGRYDTARKFVRLARVGK